MATATVAGYVRATRRWDGHENDSALPRASAKRHCYAFEASWHERYTWSEKEACEPMHWGWAGGSGDQKCDEGAWEDRQVCQYFKSGQCMYGDTCWNLHLQDEQEQQQQEQQQHQQQQQHQDQREAAQGPRQPPAAVRFIVGGPSKVQKRYCRCSPPLHSGPLRLRIVGDIEELGSWDPQDGIDLFWEGDKWTSMVLTVAPEKSMSFCLVSMEESECHPGVLQGYRREEAHESRKFEWGFQHDKCTPPRGQVLEVCYQSADLWWDAPPPSLRQIPRASALAFAHGAALAAPLPIGRQQCYTFDAPDGLTLPFCMYLPPKYGSSSAPKAPLGGDGSTSDGWPLLLFLHSMHGRLDGDNNMFYESDTPLRLLLGHPSCPVALRERFIVVSPQCPLDPDRFDGAGIWLRNGWYEVSTYAQEQETALAALIEAVCGSFHVDRRRICVTGTSMGAYASLELASRWPGVFAAAAPVAAHYDLDPVEDLVERLTTGQALPLWFFHAENDGMCPFEPMEDLVKKLRARSRAEVKLTSFTDTWSNQGHCADRVPYWAAPRSPGQEALGEQLFSWLCSQRGPGRTLKERIARTA